MSRTFRVVVNGKEFVVDVEELHPRADAAPTVAVGTPRAVAAPAAPRPGGSNGNGHIRAPIPGVIEGIKVQPGEQVNPGDVLLILEAMKMKNEILSPYAARVKEIPAVQGRNVAAGDVLVVLE